MERMVEATAKELTHFLEKRVGNSLRTVVIVKEEGYSVVHINDKLREQYTQESFSDVVESFRLERPHLNPDTHERPLGERKALVHYHQQAFRLQFPFSARESILVSLDCETGRDLLVFIEECRKRVAAHK
jgi:hypothetical protein